MSSLEEHQMYCESDDCPCQHPAKKGECLQCRSASGRNDFCSDWCGMTWAENNGATFIETSAGGGEDAYIDG